MQNIRQYATSLVAAEVSAITRYFDKLIQWQPLPHDSGLLREWITSSIKTTANSLTDITGSTNTTFERVAILLNGNINHDFDIEKTLADLKTKLTRFSRVILVAYNPYFRYLYRIANRFGIRTGEIPETFVTETDLSNIAKLAGYEVVRTRPVVYCPWKLWGIGDLINRTLPCIPFAHYFGLVDVIVLRPVIPETSTPSISIIIPARNEKGNIENSLKRMPEFGGAKIEVIFVEGHSNDETWEEIQRVILLYQHKFPIAAYKQSGKGKSDAVRLGFSKATLDLVTILDADLTMPPELLERFYRAYTIGLADFINGNRLTYPMEGHAMKFLNRLGNVFFAKSLSFVLGVRIGDSLCGTKLLSRADYERMCQWRRDFGDFDPFGDFELLFPASELALGIVDVIIRYRDRVYGSTNIRRFYHGWMLLKMTAIGLLKVKLGKITR